MRITFSILLMLICLHVSGQEGERCLSTIQNHEKRMEEDPEYKNHIKEWISKTAPIIKQRREDKNPTCTSGPLMIPVAVHFDSGLVMPSEEACVITIVQDQIDEMNLEIMGLDSDAGLIANFASCFGANILGDACMEFCIATQNHPAGYGLVNGDLAITFGQLNFSVPSGNFTPVNSDWAGYVNIYVDNLAGGLLGVSNGIPGQFNGDGVLVDNCVFGTGNINCTGVQTTGSAGCFAAYDEGETLAHELGHYFGLFHIWGDNSGCGGSQDQIPDTPNMSTNYSGLTNCNDNTCADLPQTCGSEDMYMNFMSYAGDACMYMFTSDQSDVMYATAVAEGYTTTSSKCTIAPPVADFTPSGSVPICSNECIQFTDLSTNTPTSWTWAFTVTSGNLVLNITSSTDQNPVVCPTSGTSGTIVTQLLVTNAGGNDGITLTQNVTITPGTTYYLDDDGDGFGISTVSEVACSPPTGFVLDNTDCNDGDATIYPGAPELCDGLINDCNTTSLPLVEFDDDSDGFVICTIDMGGWKGAAGVVGGDDCDDINPAVNPEATEVCDGIDNDCDNLVDENGSNIYYLDADGDTFGDIGASITGCSLPTGYVIDSTDCDDTNPAINPAATEVCDGVDNNCDGMIDENLTNTYYADSDSDGFGDVNTTLVACTLPSGYTSDNTDCNDSDSTVYPGAPELCDGQINNCSNSTLPDTEIDNDADGYVECTFDAGGWDGVSAVIGGDDCDDMEADNYPGNTEVCDGIDNDCDGMIDEELLTTYYADTDGDGFGDATSSVTDCSPPSGYVTNNTDCDDTEADNYPGNTEVCDGIDNNCDGIIDEGCGPPPDCDGDYIVINTITNYTYRAEINVTSDAVIDESGQSVLFTAGTDIDLVYPFEVILGTTFEARIEPCTPMPIQDDNSSDARSINTDNALEALFSDYDEIILSIDIKNSEGEVIKSLTQLGAQASSVVAELLSSYSKGMYTIEIQNKNQRISQKVLLVK